MVRRDMTKTARKLEERVAKLENETKRTKELLDKCISAFQDVAKRLAALEDDERVRRDELSATEFMHEYLTGETSSKVERKQ